MKKIRKQIEKIKSSKNYNDIIKLEHLLKEELYNINHILVKIDESTPQIRK